MATYQQMGHHSENLLFEEELRGFAGAILSPVNYPFEKTREQVERCREDLEDYDTLFDPQLYYPNTERGVLDQWAYYPEDVDTADLSSDTWWQRLVEALADEMRGLRPTGICSPAVVPRVFSDEYYTRCIWVTRALSEALEGEPTRVLQTALVNLPDLTEAGRSFAIASVLSRSEANEAFLVVIGEEEPRRELTDTEGLKGVMTLIAALEGAGIRVVVGFCSSDVLLWKSAGASACATGKFFNLRRFTSSRFEEPGGGGGQLAYWMEESLLAFLRESDLLRVQEQGLLSEASERNPYGQVILAQLAEEPGEAWVGLGWRQYMYWFQDVERRLERGELDPRAALREAERRWLDLEDEDILMEEARNDGRWIRPWRRALAEFSS